MNLTRRPNHSVLLVAVATLAVAGVAGVSTTAVSPLASSPVILGVAPPNPERSDTAQMLTISGREFQPNLTLDVLSPDGAMTAVKGSEIRALTPASFQVSLRLAVAGDHTLTVTNPDGGVSAPFVLTVGAPRVSTAPVIDRVLPPEVPRGPQAQELVVEGQRFTSDLRAIVTDPAGEEVIDVAISRVEPTSFRLRVMLDKAGDYELSVSNAAGEVSNVVRIVSRFSSGAR
ncbi:MAG TPA: hypothetical protein VMM93_13180 [Vicinamibacterales bacterium]|nr:hypothetical protein [Vicinamibacterales bacterium]